MKYIIIFIIAISLLYSCDHPVPPDSKVTIKVMFFNTYWTGYGYTIDTTFVVDRGAKYSTPLFVHWSGTDTNLVGKMDINYFKNNTDHNIKITWDHGSSENIVVFDNGTCNFKALSGDYYGRVSE